MKLLMCGQEAGTHKDHQKALSYLALWQGSGHQTVPCRSTTIRKAAGKQSICKVSAQLTSMHLAPYLRCFWVSGICVCLQHFSNTRRGSQEASWILSWVEVLAWALVPSYFTCPIQSELNAEQLSRTWHTGWNAGSWHSSIPWSSSHTTTALPRPFMHQAGSPN